MSARQRETVRVFVYGTLKAGFKLYFMEELMANRLEVEEATVRGEIYDLGPFPALKLKGEGLVHGEVHVFTHPKETLAILDHMEGYHGPDSPESMYLRREVEATLKDGTRVPCFAYEFRERLSQELRIKEGRWPRG